MGPRQVGKTTLLLEVAAEWDGRSVYASADTPEAALPNWREGIWRRVDALALDGAPAVLLLDEIQYLPDWSHWLRAKYDETQRLGLPIRIVASGSSFLQIGAGARESMAGRFEKLWACRCGGRGSRRKSRRMRCGTRLPRICWRAERISGRCRNYWSIAM